MTPHRTDHTLAGAAIANVRSLASAPVDSAGVAMTGIAAALTWAFGGANVPLLWVVGLSMLLDLVVGALRAVDDPLQTFNTKKLYGGFIGKLFRLLLIPTASLIDWLFIVSPLPLPEGYATAFPVTALAMYGLAAAELTSVLNKFRDGGVAPELIAAVMRHLDRTKLGHEPPANRSYDAAAIAVEIERGTLHAPLPPKPEETP